MRRLLIHNPFSKNGIRAMARVRSLLGPRFGDELTDVALAELSRVKEIPDRLVVLGGDGAVNAAADWLRARSASCPLAILPAGTGNNLARGLGIPLSLDDALRLALEGADCHALDAVIYRAREEDRERIMVQTSALGYPADMAARYDSLRRSRILRLLFRPLGPHVYRLIGLTGLIGQKLDDWRGKEPLRAIVDLEGERLDESILAIFMGNERSLGGDFHPCPLARVDDGLLDICIVRTRSGTPYLRIFRDISRGTHTSLAGTVTYRRTPGPVRIRLSTPCRFLVDGDLWVRSDEYRLHVEPHRFQVVCG